MKCWTVYCHTHIESGRRYVGITSRTMERRWAQHCCQAKSSKGGRWHFPNAIRKYGPEAFEHQILGVYYSLEEANKEEERLIDEWDLRNSEKGFNLARGGEHKPHPIRKNPWDDPAYRARQIVIPKAIYSSSSRLKNKQALNTPESKTKRSAISKEIQARLETKAKISAKLTGRILSPEHVAKMSIAGKGRAVNPKTRAKIRAWFTPEVRAELSKKYEGRKLDQKTIEKIRTKGLGNTYSRKFSITINGISKVCDAHGIVSGAEISVVHRSNGTTNVLCKRCCRDRQNKHKSKRRENPGLRRVSGRMGYYKNLAIEQQEQELREIGSWAASRVPKSGGDRMSDSFTAQLDLLIAQAAQHNGSEEAIVADMAADAAQEGLADQADTLERMFERQSPAPEPLAAAEVVELAETPAQKARRLELSKPIVGAISTEKMVHGQMILNGICSQCVRCKLKLTDAVSVERGIGPECSSKGYAEDPMDPDEMGAMIELAEYPALVDFLTQHYKPLGVRGLMNGLVRIAALNRKSPIHGACATAIELLGYKNLAAALRDALIIMKIKKSETRPGHLHVKVRRREWTREWSQDCYSSIPHCYYDRVEKGLIVADRPEAKTALWRCMMRHYAGECAATITGTVRIPTAEEWAEQKARKAS